MLNLLNAHYKVRGIILLLIYRILKQTWELWYYVMLWNIRKETINKIKNRYILILLIIVCNQNEKRIFGYKNI